MWLYLLDVLFLFSEISCTIDALLFALETEHVTLFRILEAWNFPKKGLILKKVVDNIIQFKEGINDRPVEKWINRALQCSYGRFAMKPLIEEQKVCSTFEELNQVLCTKNVTAIDTIDSELVDATFEKKVRNQRNSHTSITVSAHIGKSNY